MSAYLMHFQYKEYDFRVERLVGAARFVGEVMGNHDMPQIIVVGNSSMDVYEQLCEKVDEYLQYKEMII